MCDVRYVCCACTQAAFCVWSTRNAYAESQDVSGRYINGFKNACVERTSV